MTAYEKISDYNEKSARGVAYGNGRGDNGASDSKGAIIAENELYQNPSVIPSNIKIIAIDEKTPGKLGPYSDWDRAYFAELIERLNSAPEAKPRVIGIDVIFSGTDNSENDKRLVEAVKNAGNVVLASKPEKSSRGSLGERRLLASNVHQR